MRNLMVGVVTATAGVTVARVGQGIFAVQHDWIWAALAVASILGGAVVVFARHIERGLQPITRR